MLVYQRVFFFISKDMLFWIHHRWNLRRQKKETTLILRDVAKWLFVSCRFCCLDAMFSRQEAADDPAKKMMARPDRENHDTSLLVLSDFFWSKPILNPLGSMYGIYCIYLQSFLGWFLLFSWSFARVVSFLFLLCFKAVVIDGVLSRIVTLPQFNSSPLKRDHFKIKVVFHLFFSRAII